MNLKNEQFVAFNKKKKKKKYLSNDIIITI